ncbi:MAG: hypothetical protein JRI68_12040 [Deltaproteobacteria bacterium]|nr:hypothetical protein [Deltaproteobacteria bacterium]
MRSFGVAVVSLVTAAVAGCSVIAGLGDFEDAPTTGAGGSTGGGGSSGTGGGTGGSTGGAGGTGGVGGAIEQPPADYSVSFGSTGLDRMGGVDTDAAGNLYIAGTHHSTITIASEHPSTLNNPFVAQLDAFLAPAWSASFDVTASAIVHDVATGDAGKTTFAGEIQSDVDFGGGLLQPLGRDAYAARFMGNGTHHFSSLWGNSFAQIVYTVDNSNAGFVIGGVFQGQITFDGNPGVVMVANGLDGFIASFDSANNFLWAQQLTDTNVAQPGGQEVRALCVHNGAQRVYVTGIHDQSAIFDGLQLAHTGNGSYDGYVLSLNLVDGTLVDHATYTDEADIVPRDIAYGSTDVVIVGSFDGGLDVGGTATSLTTAGGPDGFVAALSSTLVGQWANRYGGSDQDYARSVAIDDQDDMAVVGNFAGTVDFGQGPRTASNLDAFVMKLSDTGNHVWSGTYGGAGNDLALAVAIDTSPRNIIVAGEFATAIDFGQGVLSSEGSSDLFVVKFPPFLAQD